MSDPGEPAMTKYEAERAARIKRNQAMLAALDLSAAVEQLGAEVEEQQEQQQAVRMAKRARLLPAPGCAPRRSGRSAAHVAAAKLAANALAGSGDSDADAHAESSGRSSDEDNDLPASSHRPHKRQKALRKAAENEYSPSASDASSSGHSQGEDASGNDDDDYQQEESEDRQMQRGSRHRASTPARPGSAHIQPSNGSKATRQRQGRRSAAVADAAIAENGSFGGFAGGVAERLQPQPHEEDDEEDWELQMALAMSREEVATVGERSVGAGAGIAAAQAIASSSAGVQHADAQAARSVAAMVSSDGQVPAAQASAAPPAAEVAGAATTSTVTVVDGEDGMAAAAASGLAPRESEAGPSSSKGKLQPSSSSKPPKPRRSTSSKGKGATVVPDLPSQDDIFDIFCMLQPDEEGCVSISSINKHQQQLGMHFDEDTLSLMMALAQQLPPQQLQGSFRQELAEDAGKAVRKLGLEHFQRLVQFLGQASSVAAGRRGSGGKPAAP